MSTEKQKQWIKETRAATLEEIHGEMQLWVYGPNVEMNECGAEYFLTWFMHFRDYEVADCGPLCGFDIESVIAIMERWIKEPYSATTLP